MISIHLTTDYTNWSSITITHLDTHLIFTATHTQSSVQMVTGPFICHVLFNHQTLGDEGTIK